MSLEGYSKEQLQMEIERREKREELKKQVPQPKDNPDFSSAIAYADRIIQNAIENGAPVDSDHEHYMYESVMTSIYGKDFWEWWYEI